METKEQVLEAMKKAGVPLNAGKIVELTGLDRQRSGQSHETTEN